jgi:SulP family sulfate permease
VIDCSIVPYIDTTAGTALRVLARKLKGKGIAIALAELLDDVRENLKAIGAEQDLGPIAAHRSIEHCLPQGRPAQ